MSYSTERDIARAYNNRKFATDLKYNRGCADCGTKEGHLEWDHIDPKTKQCPVSHMYGGSFKAMLNELKKCQVLCRSCHDIKTYPEKEIALNKDGWAIINQEKNHRTMVKVEDTYYHSASEAGRNLGIDKKTVIRRCKSKDHSNYSFVDEANYYQELLYQEIYND